MDPLKIIVTNKNGLIFKYGKQFGEIQKLLAALVAADKKRSLRTMIVYVDDAASAKTAKIKKLKNASEAEYKRVVDDLYAKHVPAYIMLFGAQDIVPFQQLQNTADDDDGTVPSDLPYACDHAFSRKPQNFTGPTRVVGRLPDIPGKTGDLDYLRSVLGNIIRHKPYPQSNYFQYFAVSAKVWHKSTEQSLHNMFGDVSKLRDSPGAKAAVAYAPFTSSDLRPMTHFYNCHGAPQDLNFYGQRGQSYPEALESGNLVKRVRTGTIVAAECCYGAALIDTKYNLPFSSIANNYLREGAIGFVGSSTIAYGTADSQSLADLITQYFIKSVLQGASTGRALLEARQQFLSENGPDLDPNELKTIAQFYLLGDPSIQPAECEEAEIKSLSVGNAVMNSRKRLFNQGKNLESSIAKTIKTKKPTAVRHTNDVRKILRDTGFTAKDRSTVYKVVPRKTTNPILQKKLGGKSVQFHTYVQKKVRKHPKKEESFLYKVLVVKENSQQVLGYRTYYSH